MDELSIPQKMNNVVSKVLTQNQIVGFEKAFVVSTGIQELRDILTPEYMKPIMAMMNTRLGFKTDRPSKNKPVYTESEVKECLIEAVFMGLQPYGNEFNIIAGNCYPTKEGMGALLSKEQDFKYTIVPDLPNIVGEKASIKMAVSWTKKGQDRKQDLVIPIKVNSMMGTDAVIGKATRKARAWLYSEITGSEIVDGDVSDFLDITPKKTVENVDHGSKLEEIKTLWRGGEFEMPETEKERVDLIIENKEILSYDKVLKHLKHLKDKQNG